MSLCWCSISKMLTHSRALSVLRLGRYTVPVLNVSLSTCGMCPMKPVDCGCPQDTECELGCALAFGAPVPTTSPPTPPPTPPTPPYSPKCTTDYNCSFNGVCSDDGVCVCEKQWTGDFCHQLNLLPIVNGTGLNQVREARWWP